MQKDRLVFGLTVVFAAMTVLVVLIAVVIEPVLFVVALPLGAATALFWYQSSGKLRERVYRSRQSGGRTRESRGGFGTGARRETRRDRQRAADGDGGRRRRRGSRDRSPSGLSPAEAYRRLDLEAGADESEIRRAYRRKVKEVHPDRGGDEEAFRRVTEAYETLTE